MDIRREAEARRRLDDEEQLEEDEDSWLSDHDGASLAKSNAPPSTTYGAVNFKPVTSSQSNFQERTEFIKSNTERAASAVPLKPKPSPVVQGSAPIESSFSSAKALFERKAQQPPEDKAVKLRREREEREKREQEMELQRHHAREEEARKLAEQRKAIEDAERKRLEDMKMKLAEEEREKQKLKEQEAAVRAKLEEQRIKEEAQHRFEEIQKRKREEERRNLVDTERKRKDEQEKEVERRRLESEQRKREEERRRHVEEAERKKRDEDTQAEEQRRREAIAFEEARKQEEERRREIERHHKDEMKQKEADENTKIAGCASVLRGASLKESNRNNEQVDASSSLIYRAEFDFAPAQEEDLELRAGDLIQIFEELDENWWRGKNISTGKIGVFPNNHVELVDKAQLPSLGYSRETDNESEEGSQEKVIQGKAQAGSSQVGNGTFYVAQYDFQGVENGDLGFQIGDIIEEIEQLDSDWYRGKIGERIGIFPAAYVSMKENEHQTDHTELDVPKPGTNTLGKFVAAFDYDSEEPGDLTFTTGEIITVTEKVDDSWWKGYIGEREGIFPSSFVSPG